MSSLNQGGHRVFRFKAVAFYSLTKLANFWYPNPKQRLPRRHSAIHSGPSNSFGTPTNLPTLKKGTILAPFY